MAQIGHEVVNKNGFVYHGISFNFNMDKKFFSYINPCGQDDLEIVNFVEINSKFAKITIKEIEDNLVNNMIKNLYVKDSE